MSIPKGKVKLLVLDVDGTLTDGGMYISDSGEQFKKFNAKDGVGIRSVQSAGVEVGIISHSSVSKMIHTRANMLNIRRCYVGGEDKVTVLKQWMQEMDLRVDEVLFVGDDSNDKPAMEFLTYSACPNDAVDEIKKIATIVLSKKGGEACVRELIDNHLLEN